MNNIIKLIEDQNKYIIELRESLDKLALTNRLILDNVIKETTQINKELIKRF